MDAGMRIGGPTGSPPKHGSTDTAGPPAFRAALDRAFAGRQVPPYEVRSPARPNGARQASEGVMLLIHGGGWAWTGEHMLRSMDDHVRRWTSRGWTTVNIDHRPGGDSLEDVLAFHDAIRSWQGEHTRLGVAGKSAGGHLGLMLAARRPDVEFVVAESAPTDLPTLRDTPEARQVQDLGRKAFGTDGLERMSPTTHAQKINARLLLSAARDDRWVPASQLEAMRAAGPAHLTTLVLEPGPRPFTHSSVSNESLRALWKAEREIAR
jgi:dipeptidyl aminopeptidase/acylaminoacyl peptidase